MSRNNKYLLIFAVIVIVPVVVIWTVAWPILRPWNLPVVARGTLEQATQQRPLTEDEVQAMNHWLYQNRTGWGVSGEEPPEHVVPKAVYRMSSAEGRVVIVSSWHFKHGEDVVGIQTEKDGAYRMRSFDHAALHLPGSP